MYEKIKQFNSEKYIKQNLVYLIVLITILKVMTMGFFTSDYQNLMFIPFATSYINGRNNPYEFYYTYNLLASFPYPPLMLWIESIGAIIIDAFHVTSIYITNIIFKLPLLIADLTSLFFLFKICAKKEKYIIILYFCSPIIWYSTYMHGQLDIIPTTFLIIAIYNCIKGKTKNIIGFIIFLSAAVCSKFHIIAVVPLLIIYLWQKKGAKAAVLSSLSITLITLCVIYPFFGPGFVNYVILNKQQTSIFNVFFNYGIVKLYIPVLAIGIIYLRIIQMKNMNKELLYCFVGVIFAVFLIFVPPMPAWFIWIVPFVLIYLVAVNESRCKVLSVYAIFQALYIVYFVFLHKTQYIDLYFLNNSLDSIKIDNSILNNIMFTLLTASLITIIYAMYHYGIEKNALYARNGLPFTIGIAGDSGSGKSELLNIVESLLGIKNILYIEGDGDHRWERGDKNWDSYTHLDPKANYLYRQAKDIEILRNGSVVKRVEYDHNTGTFTEAQRIVPKPYVIMCGLHSLYLPQMRKSLDLEVYMNTDEKLRRFWKIQRDTTYRGYSSEKIIAQIEKRIPDAEKYIYPQKQYADISITYFDKTLDDITDVSHQVKLSIRFEFVTSIELEPLLNGLVQMGLKSKHSYNDDLNHQTVEFDGYDLEKCEIDYEKIAHSCIEQYDDLLNHAITWDDNVEGLIELFFALAICNKMRGI